MKCLEKIMKKKTILKNEEGFTLIEIIAVLVIMGILAAVAVPKFFDLQTQAREKAVYTATSELKVRVNQHFAKQLLDGKAIALISYTAASVGIDVGPEFLIKDWDELTDPLKITFKVNYPVGNVNALDYDQEIIKPKTN